MKGTLHIVGRRWLQSLQRITSTGNFIPEVDGLRFLAIITVVAFHLQAVLSPAYKVSSPDGIDKHSLLLTVFSGGWVGVYLFFVISGFILGLPFATWFIKQGKPVILSRYFLRRVTRLEPPYIISLLLGFILITVFVKSWTPAKLIPHLMASLVYSHNLLWPRAEFPRINGVIWTLEIEVQFYILAPVFAQIFRLRKLPRRLLLVALIASNCVFSQYIATVPHRSILDFYDFFLGGFLLADFYVCGEMSPKRFQTFFLIAALVFASVIWSAVATAAQWDRTLYSLPIAIPLFYFCVFRSALLRKIISYPFITVIGGMCYSIYLLHFPILEFCARKLPKIFASRIDIDYSLRFTVALVVILAGSTLFYKLVEQPCMRKDWPQRLYASICARLGRRSGSWPVDSESNPRPSSSLGPRAPTVGGESVSS